jgi:hypothetical protein
MNELDWLKRMDAAASRRDDPPIDVADRVLETLRSPMRFRTLHAIKLDASPSLWAATGLSWAAAAAALFLAIQSVTQLQDPFSDFLNPLHMVLR